MGHGRIHYIMVKIWITLHYGQCRVGQVMVDVPHHTHQDRYG